MGYQKPSRKKPGAKMGRPSTFTPELGLAICSAISSGASLRSVSEMPGMPDRGTVLGWTETHPDFCRQYARACDERGHWLAEDALRIADGPVRIAGGKMDAAAVQDKRVRVDTRRWFASKLAPKVYGDRVAAEVSGPGGGPVQLAPMDWDALLTKLGARGSSAPAEPPAGSGEAGEA
jgi:hypothetical protein